MRARITYEVWAPDHEGEPEDTGYYLPSGWKFSDRDPKILADMRLNPKAYELGKLRYVLRTVKNMSLFEGSTETYGDGRTEINVRGSSQDYPTGYDICFTLNISGLSASSVERVKSLLEDIYVSFA